MRTYLSTLLLLLSPALALAQTDLVRDTRMVVDLDVELAQFRRAMPARIGDDGDLDVVVLDTTPGARRLLYMPNPGRHNSPVVVTNDVVDAAILPGGGSAGRDAILVLSSTGLKHFDAGTGEQSPVERPASLQTHADWLGAQRLWVALDSAGVPCVFALSASGTQIARWRWSTTHERLAPLGTMMNAAELLTMNYDGIGENEIVVRLGTLVVVLDWNSLSVIASFWFATNGNNMIAVSRGDGSSDTKRDLLVAYGSLLGAYQLFVLNSSPSATAFVPLGNPVEASSMAVYDHDGDGFQDILLANALQEPDYANAWFRRVQVVRRDAATGAFSTATTSHQVVHGVLRQDPGLSTVCGGDFDGDGDGDVLGFSAIGCYMHLVCGAVSAASRVQFSLSSEVGVISQGGVPTLQVPIQAVLPAGWASLAQPGETVYVDFAGWVRNDLNVPREDVASVQLRVAASALQPKHTVLLPNTAVNAEKWSVRMQARLVCVGPSGERVLPAHLRFRSPDPAQMDSQRRVSEICLLGDFIEIGTGGDGNTGGQGTKTEPPPRP